MVQTMHGPAATQAKNKTLSEQFEKAHFCPSGLVKKGLKKYIFVHSATQSRRKSSILLPWSPEEVRTIDLIIITLKNEVTFSNVSVCYRSNRHPSARLHFVSVFGSVSGVPTSSENLHFQSF